MSDVATFTLYAPLRGATFDSDGVALLGGQVLVNIPFEDEWRNVQHHDVVLERLGGDLMLERAGRKPPPPVCLTVMGSLASGEHLSDGMARSGDDMLQQAHDAVTVLRLHKPGWFLDPNLAETCFASGGFFVRRPGPYRQEFQGDANSMGLTSYQVEIAELTVDRGHPGALTHLWDQLMEWRERSGNASVEIALDNFNLSYGYQLIAADRLAYLFMALDAILGGMSARRIAAVPLRKGFFRQRVRAALSLFQQDSIAAGDAAWLDDRRGGRKLRNAIAHGDSGAIGSDATAAVERLQQIVRLLLRQYLVFSVRWADNQPVISSRFALPADCPIAAAYNKVLEARAAEEDAAVDILS